MLLSKLFKVSYFRISSSLQIPIHDLSSPALPPPRLQAPSRVAVVDLVEHAEQHASPRRFSDPQGPARRHWPASPASSVPRARHMNHGARITGTDPFGPRDLAMRPRPRGTQSPPIQGTRSGTRSRSACTRPHLFVAGAQQHLTTAVGSGRRYRAPSLLCRKRVDDALYTFCGMYHGDHCRMRGIYMMNDRTEKPVSARPAGRDDVRARSGRGR